MSSLANIFQQLKGLSGLLLPILGPIAYRKGMGLYRQYKSPKRQSKIHPLGLRNLRIIVILAVTGFLFLFGYIPLSRAASNPNLFELTNSRIQTPSDVIKSRLINLYAAPAKVNDLSSPEAVANMPWSLRRTAKFATSEDWDRLFSRMLTLDGRVLYTAYGTSAYLYCDFCRTDYPPSFLTFSMPTIAAPYLFSLLIILLATRGPKKYLATVQSGQWSQTFSLLCLGGMIIEVAFLAKYPLSPQYANNVVAADLAGLHFPFSSYVTARGIFLGCLNLTLAVLVYLGGTGRAYDNSFSEDGYYRTTQRLIQALDFDINKLRVATLLHSDVIAPNPEFRKAYEIWGANASESLKQIEKDEAVKEAKQNAKQRKQAMLKTVEVEAKALVDRI